MRCQNEECPLHEDSQFCPYKHCDPCQKVKPVKINWIKVGMLLGIGSIILYIILRLLGVPCEWLFVG